jgi:high affinity Mn2+ porin
LEPPDGQLGDWRCDQRLSRNHRDFLGAGATGLRIGDEQLSYRPEWILETYYSIGLWAGTTMTAEYQFIVSPAYNADRGPVSIFSGRFQTSSKSRR